MIERYSPAMRILHWTAAGLILPAILIGFALAYELVAPRSAMAEFLTNAHILLGVSALMAMALRIVVALRSIKPPILGGRRERVAAKGAHYALYAMAVIMPLSGYGSSLAYGHPPQPFGLPLPSFDRLAGILKTADAGAWIWPIHSYGGHVMAALLLLHVAAVVCRSRRARRTGVIDGLDRMRAGPSARPI